MAGVWLERALEAPPWVAGANQESRAEARTRPSNRVLKDARPRRTTVQGLLPQPSPLFREGLQPVPTPVGPLPTHCPDSTFARTGDRPEAGIRAGKRHGVGGS